MRSYALSTYVLIASLALVGAVGCEREEPTENVGAEMGKSATGAMEKTKEVEATLERAAEKTAAEVEKAAE